MVNLPHWTWRAINRVKRLLKTGSTLVLNFAAKFKTKPDDIPKVGFLGSYGH